MIMEMRQVAMMSKRSVALFVAAVVAAASVLPPRPALGGAAAAATDDVVVALPGCTSHCGNISIPYPFGVEPGCYLPGLNVTCDSSVVHDGSPPKLFVGNSTVEVLEISIANATVRINASFAYFPGSGKNNFLGPNPITSGTWSGALGEDGLYSLALDRNRMIVEGCNVQVFLMDYSNRTVSACTTLCDWDVVDQAWTYPKAGLGVSFCEATILRESFFYDFKVFWMNMDGASPSSAVVASIVDQDFYLDDHPWMSLRSAVLNWRVNHTTCHSNRSSAACRSSHSFCQHAEGGPDAHTCVCAEGYQGNPYIPNGCRDVNECHAPETYPCYGLCNNTQGSYQCLCPPGFVGNASVPNGCKDIDECAHLDRYPCYGDCTNMRGTFRCLCKHGTYGDPFTKGGCSSLSVLKISLGVDGGTILFAFGTWCALHNT